MSLEPPATGRVRSIKSIFENLNSLDPLDISTSIKLSQSQNNQQKIYNRRPSTNFNFKRAATSHDLMRNRKVLNGDVNRIQCENKRQSNFINDKRQKSFDRSKMNGDDDDGKDTLQPLKDVKENVEVRLNRHTSDPVKRSSIKRSPAFRVGDKSIKTTTTTTTVKSNALSTSPVEVSDEKFDDLLQRCATDSEKLQQVCLSDTLKAALRQPLPTGPPPKKPPRTFADSPSPRDNVNVEQLFKQKSPTVSTEWKTVRQKSPSPTRELQNKINLLEKELIIGPKTHVKTTSASKKFGNSFMKCIPCSSVPIYDTAIVQPLTTTSPNGTKINGHANGRTNNRLNNEPIYMEPFEHLKSKTATTRTTNGANNNNGDHCNGHSNGVSECAESKSTNNSQQSRTNNLHAQNSFGGTAADSESIDSSLVSCASCAADDHSSSDLSNDIHYMCTSIDTKQKSSDSEVNSNDGEHALMPSNTYEEINILVNAAFGQPKSIESTSSGMDDVDGGTNSPTETNNASESVNVRQHKKSIKLNRTLTERRMAYVRRMSNVKIDHDLSSSFGSLHRTFKSPVVRTFSLEDEIATDQNNVETPQKSTVSERVQLFSSLDCSERNDKLNISSSSNGDESNGTNDKSVADTADEANANEVTPKLFQVCLLIGYNTATHKPYIKSQYPVDQDVPQNIERLVFPNRNQLYVTRDNQNFSLVLTDADGFHIYGYCRRVAPEGCEICLPLAYCVISEICAPGFYFKILKEIESRHGQSDAQTNYLLQNLQSLRVPEAGKFMHLKLAASPRPKSIQSTNKTSSKRMSLEVTPKWLTESSAITTASTTTTTAATKKEKGEKSAAPFDLSLISQSRMSRCDEILISRPNDLRLESTELSDLYVALGSDLLIVAFSSLLLERKVILHSSNISKLSSCVLGLQTLLYPFQWQYTLVTVLPQDLVEICQTPTPLLAGLLEPIPFDVEDGIVVNLDTREVTQSCGDEKTIIPNSLSRSLCISLDMVDLLNQGKMLSSVLIAEAFLRFFVELFVGYKNTYFNKTEFIENHKSQTIRFFLEWFIETAMFRQFIHDKYSKNNSDEHSHFYDLFDARIFQKDQSKAQSQQQNMEMLVKNSRIINKKGTTFKERFKDLFGIGSGNGNGSGNGSGGSNCNNSNN